MIKYIKGDLFSHTPIDKSVSILAHACNCRGSWGAGVARVFQSKFPSAYEKYVDHCSQHSSDPSKLLGTSYLIPTSSSDPGNRNGHQFYVACLFTSDFAGRKKLTPKDIVANTNLSMQHLLSQVEELQTHGTKFESNDSSDLIVVNMPKINAGLFNVPWEDTEQELQQFDVDINVYVID
ncbi:hypothetical protein HYPBUDRAFT_144649 [Hyphopichia burtonii NRRL Y-1933]|uniref:ADP-ribose 1''-phosphate phosphatase n=1 Tax=Hyphopichia burtonii NRRL Y-1933 TaxID=984485 RepID=A0A1E4RBZ1_9ASCO|nr:hypothetical protein HYPBUDRAFT_144649 [Hyphopichia burtonii NRRL Y-1933]ODV64788.1 hypothetical protein HYPBUDRAFT_144649 [Hyphopichia burtonii NRRL Y-1933]